jgi:hypothetical protein
MVFKKEKGIKAPIMNVCNNTDEKTTINNNQNFIHKKIKVLLTSLEILTIKMYDERSQYVCTLSFTI